MTKKSGFCRWIVLMMIGVLLSCKPSSTKLTEYGLFWRTGNTTTDTSHVFQMNTQTEEEKLIHSLPDHGTVTWVSLCPDQPILTCATESDQGKQLWWSFPRSDWQTIETTPTDSYLQKPYWMPDAKGFLYLKALGETQQGDFIHYATYELMMWIVSEKKPYSIGSFQSPASSVSWSPDNTKVAFFAQTEQEALLWVYDIATRELSSLCSVEADQYSRNRIHWVDQQTLVWLEVKTLFRWDLLQKKKETLASFPDAILGFDFYLPASRLCLVYPLPGQMDKMVCLLYSWETKKSQMIANGYQIDSPRFSPDGSQISFFLRLLESEKPDLVVYSLLSQKKTTVCTVGKIMIFPWDANPTYSAWSPDSNQIVLENKQEDDSIVQLYSLSPLKLVKEIVQTEYIYSYHFSPGSEWLQVEYPREEETMTTLYHWKTTKVIDFSGEWLGWTTEDFS